MISVYDFLDNIDKYIIITSKNNNKYDAIKVTKTSKYICIDRNTLHCDIINNIKCHTNTYLSINNKVYSCNINKMTILSSSISTKLEIVSEFDIIYDIYQLSDKLKKIISYID